MLRPEVLILSNRHDYASDYICSQLWEQGIPYLRLNTDDMPEMELCLYPTEPRLEGVVSGLEFCIDSALRSVYFRCPVFLREMPGIALPAHDQMVRSQWASFVRNLTVFQEALWVNHPGKTYLSENKALQLLEARKAGLTVPRSIVTNSTKKVTTEFAGESRVMLKSLDTLLVRQGDVEAFAYAIPWNLSELAKETMSAAPATVQPYFEPKVDWRVTVVGKKLFAVKILKDEKGVSGDWRLEKDRVRFVPSNLPAPVSSACLRLTKQLGLIFGAIDLVEVGGEFVFLEINPTGEWAWLVEQAGLPIDREIAKILRQGEL